MSFKVLPIVSLLSLFMLTSTKVHAQVSLGGGLSYGTEAETIGLTIGGLYTIEEVEHLRVGGNFVWYLPKEVSRFEDQRWFELNINANYTIYEKDEVSAYVLSGLNFANVALKYEGPNSSVFSNTSDLKAGLNLGVGGEYVITNQLKAFAEFKFTLSNFDQAALSAGIRLPIPF